MNTEQDLSISASVARQTSEVRESRRHAVGGVRVLLIGGGEEVVAGVRAAAGPRGTVRHVERWQGTARYFRAGKLDLVVDARSELGASRSTDLGSVWESRLIAAACSNCAVVAAVALSGAGASSEPRAWHEFSRRGYAGVVDLSSATAHWSEAFAAHVARALAARQALRRIAVLEARCRKLHRDRAEANAEVGRLTASIADQRAACDTLVAEASMVAEYRTLLTMELDLDSTLRVGLSAFVLRTGNANAALLLPLNGGWRVAAYLKHTRSRHAVDGMLKTIAEEHAAALCSQRAPVSLQPNTTTLHWNELHGALFGWSALVVPCWGESMAEALIVTFRESERAYEPAQVTVGQLLADELGRTLERNRRVQSRSAA